MPRRRALTAGITAALLTVPLSGCTGDSDGATGPDDASGTAEAQSPATDHTEAPDAADLSAVSDGADDDELTCGEPPVELLEWGGGTGVDEVSDAGPVIGAAVVFAATTSTGDWYVLATDRLDESEDGTTTPGQGTRRLALTNAVNPPPGEAMMIELGEGPAGQTLTPGWGSVTWTGETLEAGERATERAQECLTETGDSGSG